MAASETFRSSRAELFYKKGVLRKSAKCTRKHLCQRLFFNKVAGLRSKACIFIKKEFLTQLFSCEFCKFSKNTFFYRTPSVAAKILNVICRTLIMTVVKGALSALSQYLATESSLKMMKNAFYFTSKTLFFLKIFKFLPWLFGHVTNWLGKKDQASFKFYDVTAWLTNNRDTHIAGYFEK